jgi:hypothetical protein
VTYAGLYGGNDGLPVDRVLRREGHPLGVRRAEATKAAIEEPETSASHKRWTLGVAAGALLMAGTFAAGALGLHGGATPVAGSAPEHAPAAPGHAPDGGGPVAGAPVSDKGDQGQQSRPHDGQQARPTTPASAGTNAQGTPVVPDTGTGATGSNSGGGSNQRGSAPSTGTSTPAPSTGTSTPAPEPTTPPAAGSDSSSGSGSASGSGGGLLGTVGDVLSPVTGTVGDILSPSASTTSTAAAKSAPAGPALTMINPLGDLLAVG